MKKTKMPSIKRSYTFQQQYARSEKRSDLTRANSRTPQFKDDFGYTNNEIHISLRSLK